MILSDIRDYINALAISEHVYMGKMDNKEEKSIGVYNSKHENRYQTAIGGHHLKSYGMKYISILVHWNKSLRDTEKVSKNLLERLIKTREVTVNEELIKFIQPLSHEPIDIGTDDAGICEMVIEAAVIYGKE